MPAFGQGWINSLTCWKIHKGHYYVNSISRVSSFCQCLINFLRRRSPSRFRRFTPPRVFAFTKGFWDNQWLKDLVSQTVYIYMFAVDIKSQKTTRNLLFYFSVFSTPQREHESMSEFLSVCLVCKMAACVRLCVWLHSSDLCMCFVFVLVSV